VLFGLLRLVMRSWPQAACLSLLWLLLFYTYGRAYGLLVNVSFLETPFSKHLLLLLVWAGLAGLAAWISTRKLIRQASFVSALNIAPVTLLVFPVFTMIRYEIINHPPKSLLVEASTDSQPAHPSPDIYYIILDAYERADVMQAVYGYDNSTFINALTGRSFYVATCSQSNYAYTQPSLTSSLNLEYLDTLSVTSNEQADPLFQENATRQFLKAHGYTIVAFETGFRWSQWEDADVYYQYRPAANLLNGFEALYLQTTLARIPLDITQSNQDAAYGVIPHDRVLYVLDTLKNLPTAVASPKFVFVHLVIPHPPFVFSPDGELVTQGAENATSVEGYRNSVTFINQEMLQVIDSLISGSKTPPVIVIQGDHGAPLYHNPFQRMGILNAYYLPDAQAALYPSISPVNTFRVILDSYFGQGYPLLDDVSWYSPTNREYDFTAIPNECGQ
jgi:hypothetical protein